MLFASRYHNIAEFTKPSGKTIHHWSENVIILTIFSTLAALPVVKMTSGAMDQTDLIKMVFPSQWYIPLPWRHMNDTVSQSLATRLFVQKPAQANNAWNIKSPKCWLALIQSIPLTKDQLCCLWHWHCKANGSGIPTSRHICPEWFYMFVRFILSLWKKRHERGPVISSRIMTTALSPHPRFSDDMT